MANHLDVTDLMAKNAALQAALRNARSSLVAFGGDPTREIATLQEAEKLGVDTIQFVLLQQIDEALKV